MQGNCDCCDRRFGIPSGQVPRVSGAPDSVPCSAGQQICRSRKTTPHFITQHFLALKKHFSSFPSLCSVHRPRAPLSRLPGPRALPNAGVQRQRALSRIFHPQITLKDQLLPARRDQNCSGSSQTGRPVSLDPRAAVEFPWQDTTGGGLQELRACASVREAGWLSSHG